MKINLTNIINHTILLDEINVLFLEKRENFIAYGILNETNSLKNKQENTISEIFTQYVIKFNNTSKKTVSCEKNYYYINLNNHDIFDNYLPLKCLNTYKVNKNTISFIHVINFLFKDELLNSIYFPFSNSIEQKKILN